MLSKTYTFFRFKFLLAICICFFTVSFRLNQSGISMAVPMKNGGMKKSKVIFYVIMSGITTGIGAFFGAILGGISKSVIAFCLSFAARSNALYSIWGIASRI